MRVKIGVFIKRGGEKNGKPKKRELKYVADFIHAVTVFEKNEYNNYLDWLYHEMERQIN